MTPRQIDLIRTTFGLVLPIRAEAAELFYRRLFQIDPSTQKLFAQADMRSQGVKLMAALATLVNSLDDLAAVLPRVEALGRAHAAFGVRADHYDSVGAALLWTLEQGIGPERFTREVRDAWVAAYTRIAGVMIDAAADARTAAA